MKGKKKPEVVVTKAKRKPVSPAPNKENKMDAFINLLPAPTPTRFVGKMHKLKGDSQRKKLEASKSRPKTASRRSSVAPSTETIKEMKEISSAASKSTSGTTISKAVGKVKMGVQKDLRKDSVVTDKSSTSTTPSIPSGKSKVSTGSSKRKSIADTSSKKSGSGLAALRAKAGMFASKKKRSQGSDDSTGRDLKMRLFFNKRFELSDEEILSNLGVQDLPKAVGHGIKEIAHAANFMKKFIKVKEKDIPHGTNKMEGFGIPTSILYVGALKARLVTREKNLNPENDDKQGLKHTAINSTRFLGKMISKKDKHGLYRGTPESSPDENAGKILENPVIMALEKVKLKPQITLDSSDSRAPSRASRGSHKSNVTQGSGLNKDGSLTKGETVGSLHKGLAKVKVASINEWNLHKHIRGDRELKPISIPF